MKSFLKDIFTNGNERLSDKVIVDTFFNTGTHNPHQKKRPKKRSKLIPFMGLLFVSALVLSVIIIILYNSKKHSHLAGYAALDKTPFMRNIVKGGEIDRANVEEAYFDGDAKEESSFLKNSVKLVNSGRHGRAAFVIKFRDDVDLYRKNILVLARANHGFKKIKLILKDDRSRFYEFGDMTFSPEWTKRNVYLEKGEYFDFKKIKELKLEFGSFTAGNDKNTVFYLKDIIVREAR